MIIPQKKKAIGVILSKMHGPDQEVKEEHSMNEHDEALKVIASELMHAIESKSAMGVVDALKAFWSEIEELDEEKDEEMMGEHEE
jgi:hypothetical protein